MATPESKQVGLPFYLYDYDHWGAAGEVHELIEAGKLPYDTFFRLASVGQRTDDDYGNPTKYLNYELMVDAVSNVDSPDQMRSQTQQILRGDLPDAIVDINSSHNYPSYGMLETVYYRMKDLVSAIHNRRLEMGQALPDAPYDRRLHTVQGESSRCYGIARPLWRLIVQRSHPEWLQAPSDYFPSRYIGTHTVVYEIGEARMKRGIVGHAVLADPLVMSVYEEAVSTGVKGIGPVGKEDLRRLLLDEHPELLEGHEFPKTDT